MEPGYLNARLPCLLIIALDVRITEQLCSRDVGKIFDASNKFIAR